MAWTLILAAALAQAPAAEDTPKGHLFIVGGGPTTDAVRQKAMELAGGTKAKVLLVPHASTDPEAGRNLERYWKEFGAENVRLLDVTDPKEAVKAIEDADLIWMRGGNQTRLMDALAKPGVIEAIRDRYRRGATIAGSSAGAAVMSGVMIAGTTGPRNSPGGAKPRLSRGLDLWPNVIVDQHFLKRQRLGRLQAAVHEHPELVGVGIDESTAVVVSGREFEVWGQSDVLVVDARKGASKPKEKEAEDGKSGGPKGEPMPAEGEPVRLKPGSRYHLDRGILSTQAQSTDSR
jgi:cyanophycinase